MQQPANFQPVAGRAEAWTLDEGAKITLKEGFASELKKGTNWRQTGQIDQGNVFHTTEQLVTVEASNQHEADLVLRGTMVVGFFLVVERTFTPASRPVEIKLTPR